MKHILQEGGANLPSGQRQRIAIVRVIVKNPNYLMLDEPTSALDRESSLIVGDALKQLSKQMTVIVITHNSDMDRFADQIIDLGK